MARRLRWEEESEEEVDDAICIIEEVLEMNPQLCLHRGRYALGRFGRWKQPRDKRTGK